MELKRVNVDGGDGFVLESSYSAFAELLKEYDSTTYNGDAINRMIVKWTLDVNALKAAISDLHGVEDGNVFPTIVGMLDIKTGNTTSQRFLVKTLRGYVNAEEFSDYLEETCANGNNITGLRLQLDISKDLMGMAAGPTRTNVGGKKGAGGKTPAKVASPSIVAGVYTPKKKGASEDKPRGRNPDDDDEEEESDDEDGKENDEDDEKILGWEYSDKPNDRNKSVDMIDNDHVDSAIALKRLYDVELAVVEIDPMKKNPMVPSTLILLPTERIRVLTDVGILALENGPAKPDLTYNSIKGINKDKAWLNLAHVMAHYRNSGGRVEPALHSCPKGITHFEKTFNMEPGTFRELNYFELIYLIIKEFYRNPEKKSERQVLNALVQILRGTKTKKFWTYPIKMEEPTNVSRWIKMSEALEVELHIYRDKVLPPTIRGIFTKYLEAGDGEDRIKEEIIIDQMLRSEITAMGSNVTWSAVDGKITQYARKKDGLIRSMEEEGVVMKPEHRKKEPGPKQLNLLTTPLDPKKPPAKEKSCPVCSKKGHWATNYNGKKIICTDYNDKDPVMKTKMDKEIAARVVAAAGGSKGPKVVKAVMSGANTSCDIRLKFVGVDKLINALSDSGALHISAISLDEYQEHFKHIPLKRTQGARDYQGNKIPVLGEFTIPIVKIPSVIKMLVLHSR